MKALTAFLAILLFSPPQAGSVRPDLLSQAWSARWISPGEVNPQEYGVYHFRRTFELASKPSHFTIHVSADNRYQLFVNGTRVVWGPARGDLYHWRFESVDIAQHLRSGKNVLAAVVWNFGEYAPEAQVTNQTGFILQGDTAAERAVDTDVSWKCLRDPAYRPIPFSHEQMRGYFVAGPGERVEGASYPWNWETVDYDDSAWPPAKTDPRRRGSPREIRDAGNRWMLVPRNIPLMEEKPQRLSRLRQSIGTSVPAGFPGQAVPFQIPPRSQARLLLDQSNLTTAYPELIVSGGRDAVITLGYAEALIESGGGNRGKGNRNEVDGKDFVGYYDTFRADGGTKRLFRPLWWRTFRYLECRIETRDQALTLEDLSSVYVGYPFQFRARFDAGSPRLDRILEIGWRTARLCAHETYMDCPYYEQLQYVGDTRIQALVSFYNSGDARLVRNAIALIDDSRTAEGATMSRAPTRQQQYIPPFSLWWIGMVRDYWMYQDDPEFVSSMLPGVRAVLGFFARFQKPNGSLGLVPWWNFVDWTAEWRSGVPPAESDGSSAPLDLQLLLAYRWASAMEEALGSRTRAAEFGAAAEQLRKTVRDLYWDGERRLFADTPRKAQYSQHSNVLAILAEIFPPAENRNLLLRVLDDRSLVRCSYYFQHYLHTALNKVGEGDRYLDQLGEWDAMISRGLSTWAEQPEAAGRSSRSDCHAWSAHPNFEIFRTVLGIDTAAPGFRRVLIRPFLGKLTRASGAIPHPRGEIAVALRLEGQRLQAEVSLPEGVTGEFYWRGERRNLPSGTTRLSF